MPAERTHPHAGHVEPTKAEAGHRHRAHPAEAGEARHPAHDAHAGEAVRPGREDCPRELHRVVGQPAAEPAEHALGHARAHQPAKRRAAAEGRAQLGRACRRRRRRVRVRRAHAGGRRRVRVGRAHPTHAAAAAVAAKAVAAPDRRLWLGVQRNHRGLGGPRAPARVSAVRRRLARRVGAPRLAPQVRRVLVDQPGALVLRAVLRRLLAALGHDRPSARVGEAHGRLPGDGRHRLRERRAAHGRALLQGGAPSLSNSLTSQSTPHTLLLLLLLVMLVPRVVAGPEVRVRGRVLQGVPREPWPQRPKVGRIACVVSGRRGRGRVQ
mmetsp:Transcript_8186/g.21099  ORF Transcript_8186/g.21099 Transcript_8186/m.21099 type:complete len:324 (+) Transcript_8186:434-1405(+)